MFSNYHEKISEGYDEFGYIDLTNAFDENHAFKGSPAKVYLFKGCLECTKRIIQVLKNIKPNTTIYVLMI